MKAYDFELHDRMAVEAMGTVRWRDYAMLAGYRSALGRARIKVRRDPGDYRGDYVTISSPADHEPESTGEAWYTAYQTGGGAPLG